ncbi:MAG: amino acid ABC transporter permease [Firmicutes bacterium]|nr:amino acid ABC transporter permease [Bacillota bacterium]
MNFTKVLTDATPILLEGLEMTVMISILSIVIGMVIGLIMCLFGMTRNIVLRGISAVYIWLIRGTPMIVQAFIVFFGVPQVINMFMPGFTLNAFTAGLITLSLNAGAYLAEIFRGGISAVPKGQTEAARSLGLSSGKTFIKVVLPQAIKIAIPSMVNQFIITVKDTSILSVIGLGELMNLGKVYVGSTYLFFETYVLVAIFYLIIISILMIISKYVEKKFNYEAKSKS